MSPDIEEKKLTVYYDGACPLCRMEIGHYQSRRGAENVDWVDIASATAQTPPDLNLTDARARFHVRGSDGALVSGAAGFSALWLALPGWRFLGRVTRAPGIKQLAEGGYRAFLVFRPLLQGIVRARLVQK